MAGKPVVMTFNSFFTPGYKAGGPIRTLENLLDHLGHEVQFRIVCQDRDLEDTEPYASIQRSTWIPYKNGYVYYMAPKCISMKRLISLVRTLQPDMIYLNSFFDPIFTQRILWARRLGFFRGMPIILAPRGQLSEGALRLKGRKKELYINAVQYFRLCDGVIWQASTEQEEKEIRRSMPSARRARVKVAKNLNPRVNGLMAPRSELGPARDNSILRLCFLSRISPKKNLDFALRVLEKVRACVHFTVYGPAEVDWYFEKCRQIARRLPKNVTVEFAGAVDHESVHECLTEHDGFLLPTHGENYGHVIFEAMSAGLYSIVSDQTPWQELGERGIGVTLPLSDEGRYIDIIEDMALWPEGRWSDVRTRASAYAQEIADDRDVLEDNRRLFLHG